MKMDSATLEIDCAERVVYVNVEVEWSETFGQQLSIAPSKSEIIAMILARIARDLVLKSYDELHACHAELIGIPNAISERTENG